MCKNCCDDGEAETELGVTSQKIYELHGQYMLGMGRYMSCSTTRRSVTDLKAVSERIKGAYGVDILQASNMFSLVRLLDSGIGPDR